MKNLVERNYNFKFVLTSGTKINDSGSGSTIGEALDKLVSKWELENETFSMVVSARSTVYVPKGKFVDVIVS